MILISLQQMIANKQKILGDARLALSIATSGMAIALTPPLSSAEDQADATIRDDAKPEKSCLLVRAIRDHRVPERGQLEFRVRANSYMKVHFRQECKQLTERSQISYRSVSSKLCRGDEVRILASLGSSADVTGICYVEGFSPVAPKDDAQ